MHVGVVLAFLAAFYKYGDRTEIFEKSLKGTEHTLIVLRREIAYILGVRLKPVFDNPRAVVEIPLLDADGNPLQEVEVSPVGSEAYMDAIADFVGRHVQHVVDYSQLLTAKARWCKWARRLSYTIFAGLVIELCILALLFSWRKLLGHDVSNVMLLRTLELTAVVVAACLLEVGVMLRCHDIILDMRNQYDSD